MRLLFAALAIAMFAACSSPGTNTLVIDHETIVHDDAGAGGSVDDGAAVSYAATDASDATDPQTQDAGDAAADADTDAAAGCMRDVASDGSLCNVAHGIPEGWMAYVCPVGDSPAVECHKLDPVQWCCPPQ